MSKEILKVLYQHRRLDTNEIFYVGIGSKKRAYSKSANRRTTWWINIINKTTYQVEILSNNLTLENAQEAEIQLIKLYGRKNLGLGELVNLTDGGEGTVGRVLNKEQCKAISDRMKGHLVTEETRKKLSIANKGQKKEVMSEETKLKISKARKGKLKSEETKLKMSKSKSRKIINIETNEIYNSIRDCSKILNLSIATLYRYVNNIGNCKIKLKYYKSDEK